MQMGLNVPCGLFQGRTLGTKTRGGQGWVRDGKHIPHWGTCLGLGGRAQKGLKGPKEEPRHLVGGHMLCGGGYSEQIRVIVWVGHFYVFSQVKLKTLQALVI